MNVDENKLILKAQLGDHDAFNSLFKCYELQLLYHIVRFLGDSEKAYDVLQETYLVIIHNIRKLRCRQSFRAWALGIATRKSLHAVRKIVREKEVPLPEYGSQNSIPSAIELMIRKEDAAVLRHHIDLLSTKLKAVVILHYQEDLSLREVAAALEIAEGTVKSRLSQALTILRSKLKKGGI